MPDNKVLYEVEVRKTGSGGAEAARELTSAAAAAQAVNNASNATTTSLTNLGNAGKNTSVVFKTLGGVVSVAGFQQFPQLTAAAMVTKNALDGIRHSGVALNANFLTVGAGVAGLAAAVTAAAFAWSAYRAQQNEAVTAANLAEQTSELSDKLREQVNDLREAGEITIDVYEQLSRVLRKGTTGGNEQVRDFLRGQQRGTAAEKISAMEADNAYYKAYRDNRNVGNSISEADQIGTINLELKGRIDLYKQLAEQGLITQRQMESLTQSANVTQLNALTGIKQAIEANKIHIQQWSDVGKASIEGFAGGLANTLVDIDAWTKDAGAAFGKFFANLASQIAEMILQMAILRMLSGIFGGAFSGSGPAPSNFGVGAMAYASGGIKFAAAGLAGVGTVSAPTFLPRFNVVAGEAGREMLTVLSRPRMMNVGGIQAAVGMAEGNKLAITDADQLAARGGGAGGTITIEVLHSPETEARIVRNSVDGAVVRVTRDMGQHTRLREAVKSASA